MAIAIATGAGAAVVAEGPAAKKPARSAASARQKDPYGKGFEGIIPNLRRRYEQATWVDQADIERYRSLGPCEGVTATG